MGNTYEVSEDEKNDWECMGHELNKLAAIWAGGAVALGVSGAGIPAAVAAGIASAGFWYLSDVAADVADDPPQLKFRKTVTIKPFSPKFVRFRSSPLVPLVRVASSALKAGPLGRGLLDAVERVQGASNANNENYVRVQSKVGIKLHRSVVSEVRKLSMHLRDTSDSLKDTEFDLKIDHEILKKLQKQVVKNGLPKELSEALSRAGFTATQKRSYREWLSKLYIRKLWTARLSYHCKVVSNMLDRNVEALTR